MNVCTIVCESSRGRIARRVTCAFDIDATAQEIRANLATLAAAVSRDGLCRSFTVAVHIDSPGCDHELEAPYGQQA